MEFANILIDLRDFQKTGEILGEGQFSKVYVIKEKKTGQKFAAKELKDNAYTTIYDQNCLFREIAIISKLDHPSIIKFKGFSFTTFNNEHNEQKWQPTIVIEYVKGISLMHRLKDEMTGLAPPEWDDTKRFIVILGVASAMNYLNQNHIIHRDLKPENIILDENDYPKVTDFGFSSKFDESMTSFVGTPKYIAPEMLRNEKYDYKIDVYSFSILAFEVITREKAYPELKLNQELNKHIFAQIMNGNLRPKFPIDTNEKMKNLIERCWSNNPQNRPSFNEIYNELSQNYQDYLNNKYNVDSIEEYIEILNQHHIINNQVNTEQLILARIFNIDDIKDSEKVKTKILKKFKQLYFYDISFLDFKMIVQHLVANKENEDIKKYVEKLFIMDDDLKLYTFNELIDQFNSILDCMTSKLSKLKDIYRLISSLFEYNNKFNKLIELQNDNCELKELKEIELLNIDDLHALSSNVFYRLSIKILFNKDEINSYESLFTYIKKVKKITKDQINIDFLKEMKVHVFDDEIIIKTQNLMKEEKSQYESYESNISNFVYKRIESNYLEFGNLSEDEKQFLHTSIVRIIHFNDFEKLGKFFNIYFKTKDVNLENIKSFTNPFKNDDPSINEFIQFWTFCRKNKKEDLFYGKTLKDFIKDKRVIWPKFINMGIKIEQSSQFFTFWSCMNELITFFLNDKANESILLPKMSLFLEDKNLYNQFQKRMQQACIEPTIQSIYVIFESLMKMFNASGIANSYDTFRIVSNNAAIFFIENPPEFFKISTGINTLLENEKKISYLLSTDHNNVVIEEYEYVRKVFENESYWEISFNNRIRLVDAKNSTNIIADYLKLKLISSRLNIVMIKKDNIIKSDECQNSEKFVNFFQTTEVLYDKLNMLHRLNFDIGDKVFTYKLLDTTEIDVLIKNLEQIIQVIDEKFSDIYKDELCLFTKEQFFALFQLISRFFARKEKSQDLISIFEGTIISNYIARTKTPLDNYYRLIKNEDKFFPIDFIYDIDSINAKFGNNLTKSSEILTNMINELTKQRKKLDEYSNELEIKGNLDEYLTGGTLRCINVNTIKDKGKHDISSKYQLHSMILYLFKSCRSDCRESLPFPTQLLICSMSVALSQINSFLGFFNSMTRKGEKCMFIVVSPIQLQPTLYDYLMTKLIKINETTVSQSRIVILFENDDLNRKTTFREYIKSINVDSFKPITNTEQLKNLYKIKDIKRSLYGIQAFYIYEKYPRTGKTHTILQHISDKYPNHIYIRILVDESTTLTTLINRLNEVLKIESGYKTIIIHFNVDIKCSTNFHLYIQNLAFFRSLNDGISIPFLANNKMVFYFEFGSRPSFDKEDFIQNVFPIADYMEEITIPIKTEEFFTYDEYNIVSHDEVKGALKIIKRKKYRRYLIEAATIAMLDQDKTFMKNNKSALDYFDNYQRLYDILEEDSRKAYKYLLNMFNDINDIPDSFKNLLISQINDVSKIISKFRDLFLTHLTYKTIKSNEYNIMRFLFSIIIDTSIHICGFHYKTPVSNDGKVADISKNNHILAFYDFTEDAKEQGLTLIYDRPSDFDELVKKFNFYTGNKYIEVKDAVKSVINVIDLKWKTSQNSPDKLFRILARVVNFSKYAEKKCNITMLVNIWRSFDDDIKESIQLEWKQNIDQIKAKNHSEINDKTNHNEIFKNRIGNNNFEKRRIFWSIIEDQVKEKQTKKDRIFEIGTEEDKKNANKKIFVSQDIYTFISNCEKYIQSENSLMLKYILTPQNIMRFIHLVYRIYANIPVILMGETGSGKTFTMKFLAEVTGQNVKLIKRVIDGGTKEEDLRAFLRANIETLTNERSQLLKEKLRKVTKDLTMSAAIRESIKSLPIEKEDKEIITEFEDIMNKVGKYIDDLKLSDLRKYDIVNEEEREGFKNCVFSDLQRIYQKIEKELTIYLFFFDEVNTAPCQWFIKEIILDRYFEGKILPHYIRFVCVVNPSRELKGILKQDVFDALDPNYNDDSQNERKNMVYKVYQIPESFVPYLFPVDLNREYGSFTLDDKKKSSEKKYLFDIDINSEFDVSIDKKVENEFSRMTYPFIKKFKKAEFNGKSNNNTRIGDIHHFSSTDMFSTSFDYSFFFSKLGDSKKALSYSHALSRVLSRINIFCCRLSYHVIYNDESFSSIRDPERCIQIMRWAYKFGIFEELPDDLDFEKTIRRLRRAFIIGLSVSFWIRLSDQKQKDGKESYRTMFIQNVCKFWKVILDKCDAVSEVKKEFKAPTPDEWIQIVEEEYKGYVDIFVDDDECVSKNNALSENIWVAFICIMNNIPLWIIGQSGASKSLAISIVINKLLTRNSQSLKIMKCPPIVSQTFLCSSTTTTEAIMSQLEKIVNRSSMYDNNYIIRLLILEEIGHADMSRFKPLVCLHKIIDNGYSVSPEVSVPVQLIGLSNYKMDSAKLNRGILLLRCSLGEEAIKKTAYDIFKSTNLAWNPDATPGSKKENRLTKYQKKIEAIGKEYQNMYQQSNVKTEKQFIGLRDFYGLIQSITKPIVSGSPTEKEMLTIIRRNFSGIPYAKENLNNERTNDIILSSMKNIFKDVDFDENYHFKKLLCSEVDFDEETDEKEKGAALEEIYEKTTVYFNMTKLIQDNINQEHRLIKTPIFRHILISTVNAAAVFILIQSNVLEFTNYNKESPYELFFPNNMSNLPDAEWISNELRRLTEIMYRGDKTAIFIGKHPCFDSLYDIFNLRYQREGGSTDGNEIFVAMVAYGGDSYPTIISSNFKAIIILESDVYNSLPQPFLNRFEKFNLTYETELLPTDLTDFRDYINIIKKKLQRDNISSAFGCYSDELLLSVYHICNTNENLDVSDLAFLSMHPADLIYSRKNDIPFEEEVIQSALHKNSNLRSSIIHLLKGYDEDYKGDSSISAFFYKEWKKAKNEGIKSVIMVPSLNNIDKIKGYDFIKFDSSNSVNIDARIRSEITTQLKEKSQNPIVISILISQGPITIDYILQYQYILDTIRGWCRSELKIVKPIHMLVIISMEHKIENLRINQSTEWPLIYLDTCYDNTIKTKNEDGLPLSLSQIIFTPLKDLVSEEIIDLDDLIKLSKESIHLCYTEDENQLIDKLIFKNEGNYNSYILNPIKKLITDYDEENACTTLENLTGKIDDLWTFKKIKNLSSPPSSAIEYLSQKLVSAIGSIMSIIFELLLSGLDPVLIDEIDQKKFKDSSIFCYLMNRKEFSSSFYSILNNDSVLVYPIDYRYSYEIETPSPCQFSFYKFVWQIASNICNTESAKDENELYEKVQKEIFTKDDSNFEDAFDDLMKSKLSSDEESFESSLSFPFIAAYLLVTADSVRVDRNYRTSFRFWISSFIEILKGLFSKKMENLTMKFIMFHLIKNRDLVNFAHDFTIIFMFFPFPIDNSKKGSGSFRSREIKFYKSLVFDEVKNSILEIPECEHINTEAAYLISRVISKNFIETINKLDIEIDKANELFRNEFATLLSIYNSLMYCTEFVESFEVQKEPKYFPFLMTIQKFFIQYGDIISHNKNEGIKVTFKIKTEAKSDYSEPAIAEKLISEFVKAQIKEFGLGEVIDVDNASSALLMYYLELIDEVYIGIIDWPIDYGDDDFGEEEEEKSHEEDE